MVNLPGLILVPLRRDDRIDGELALAALVEADEPEGCLINSLADRDEPVVLEDADLVPRPQGLGDGDPFVRRQDHAAVLEIHAVRVVEAQGVLRERRQRLAEDRVRLAVDGMGVADGVDVRMRLVDLRMDLEAGGVDGVVARDDLSLLVDADQV